jgi:hypothetical protein
MGIPAKSRKGKKAWRKNIDVQQVCGCVCGAQPPQRQRQPLLLLPLSGCRRDGYRITSHAAAAAAAAASHTNTHTTHRWRIS